MKPDHNPSKSLLEQPKMRIDETIAPKRASGKIAPTPHSDANVAVTPNIVCHKGTRSDPLCEIKDLYYHSTTGFFVLEDDSVPSGINFDAPLCGLSGVADHNVYDFKLRRYLSLPDNVSNTTVIDYHQRTHFMGRLAPHNVFHLLHDDLLPLITTIAEFSPKMPLQLVFVDHWKHPLENPWYKGEKDWWTPFLPERWTERDLQRFILTRDYDLDKPGNLHLFRNAVVGLRRSTTWYQYGFDRPQSPLELNERQLFETSKVVQKAITDLSFRFKLPDPAPVLDKQRPILIFVRERDRRILNLDSLYAGLLGRFHPKGHPVHILSMDSNSLQEILSLTRTASLIIGMHGSMLGLAAFGQNLGLIELFPYGIPATDYRVYRRMCELISNCQYQAWENMREDATVPPPLEASTPRLKGGLTHLEEKEIEAILNARWVKPHLCCEDPAWLYRIYSDTEVDVAAILDMAEKVAVRKP